MSKAAELAALIGSQTALSNRNLIINGAMQVAQRGTSHTYNNNESGYDTIDRIFSAAFVTGGSLTISQQTANYSGVDAEYFLRATPSGSVSAGSATIYSEYRVEDVISVSNKTFTLSFDAKAASNLTFQFRRRQYYGSGGSTEEYSSFSDISVTTSWQRKTITFTIPDLSGKTIGSGSFLSLFFYWSTHQGSDNLNDAAIDITNLQLEVGEQATPFEHRSFADELQRCQRYLYRIETDTTSGGFVNLTGWDSNNTYGPLRYPVKMRAAPSLSTGAAMSDFLILSNGANPTPTGIGNNGSSSQMMELNVQSTSNITGGRSYWMRLVDTSNGFMQFDAEL